MTYHPHHEIEMPALGTESVTCTKCGQTFDLHHPDALLFIKEGICYPEQRIESREVTLVTGEKFNIQIR